MIEWVVTGTFDILLVVGIPILAIVFLLKGAMVGKLLPTSVFLPGYVLAISATRAQLVVIILTSSVAYLIGQLAIYGASRRYGTRFVAMLPGMTVTDAKIERSTRLFEAYGGEGIFLTNCLPFLGGLLFIPAGATGYPLTKTTVYAYSSTLLYQGVIVGTVLGTFNFLFQ